MELKKTQAKAARTDSAAHWGKIMLANLIKRHAQADAQAGKWSVVAATLNALTRDVYVGRVGGKTSLAALVGAGIDPNTVIAQMRSVPMASELLNTLTASGVDWADDLTAFVMEKLVESGKITQQTADVMRSLSVRSEPVIVTTAEECEAAWSVDLRMIEQQEFALLSDAVKNAIGTSEQAEKIAQMRTMLDMLEAS